MADRKPGPLTEFATHWAPRPKDAFALLMLAHLVAARRLPVGDCDETFNYWEPTHYLMYGFGFQTWEYSPEFALRPYLYPLLHAFVGWVAAAFSADKLVVFFAIRNVLGVGCALCSARFYSAVRTRFGALVGANTLAFLLLSPGLYFAGTSFLPSTFAMCCFMLAFAMWFEDHLGRSVLAAAAGTVLSGWPFSAVALVPLALHFLWRRGFFACLKAALLSFAVTLGPQILVDWYYYGVPSCTICNLVIYNTRGFFGANDAQSSTNKGPLLYGTEPWHFYPVNLVLNFGPVAVLGLLGPVILLSLVGPVTRTRVIVWWSSAAPSTGVRHLSGAIRPETPKERLARERRQWVAKLVRDVIFLSPIYVWMAFMMPQAHKEERFLFVIYPVLCLSAACVLGRVQELIEIPRPVGAEHPGIPQHRRPRRGATRIASTVRLVVVLVLVVLAASRLAAVARNAGAPLKVYTALSRELAQSHADAAVNVCVGKEWHRFPSSFFLPDAERHQLRFIRSAFDGELPQPFLRSAGANATRIVQPGFNDENRLEPNRYVDLASCTYLVDMEYVEQREPRYNRHEAGHWHREPLVAHPCLDVAASPRGWRSFYVPGWSEARCTYRDYYVMRAQDAGT